MAYHYRIKPNIPIRLILQGYLVIIGCLSILFSLIYFIEFKETLEGNILITSADLPQQITNAQAGYLRLIKSEGDTVKKNDILGYIETDIPLQAVQTLKSRLELAEKNNTISTQGLRLGYLSTLVLELNDQINQYQTFLHNDQSQKIILSKNREIQLIEKKINLLKEQGQLMESDKELTSRWQSINDTLFQEKRISLREKDRLAQEYLSKSYVAIANLGEINEFQMKIEQLEQEKTLILVNQHTQLERFNQNINQAKNRLLDAITQWEETYLLQAEQAGICVLNDLMMANEYLSVGSKVMTIAPLEQQSTYGIMKLPVFNSSKVSEGQSVNVKFANYPYKEFGIVEGKIASISTLPNEEFYNLKVSFPNGLVSTYNIPFTFKQLMSGTGEIITGRYSILERVWQQLKSRQLNR